MTVNSVHTHTFQNKSLNSEKHLELYFCCLTTYSATETNQSCNPDLEHPRNHLGHPKNHLQLSRNHLIHTRNHIEYHNNYGYHPFFTKLRISSYLQWQITSQAFWASTKTI